MRHVARALATVGYVGYAPVAPGTVGSLVGVLLCVGLRPVVSFGVELGVLALVIVAGSWAADVVEREDGREDPGIVVVDEVAGVWATLLLVPLTWGTVVAGFLVFRALDILKPQPARRAEQLGGGVGIMADDLVAGAYGAVLVWVLRGVLTGEGGG